MIPLGFKIPDTFPLKSSLSKMKVFLFFARGNNTHVLPQNFFSSPSQHFFCHLIPQEHFSSQIHSNNSHR